MGETKRRFIYIVTTCVYQEIDSIDSSIVQSELFTHEIKAKQYMISLLFTLFPSSLLLVNNTDSFVNLLHSTTVQPEIIQIKELEPHQINNIIVFDRDVIDFDYSCSRPMLTKGFIKLQTALINEKLDRSKVVSLHQ